MGLCENLSLETRDLLSWIKELSCLNFLRFLYKDSSVGLAVTVFYSCLGVLQSHQGCEGVSSPKLIVVCIKVWLLCNITRTPVTLCKKEDFSVMLEFDWWQGSIFPIAWSSQTSTISYGQLR